MHSREAGRRSTALNSRVRLSCAALSCRLTLLAPAQFGARGQPISQQCCLTRAMQLVFKQHQHVSAGIHYQIQRNAIHQRRRRGRPSTDRRSVRIAPSGAAPSSTSRRLR
jgi:hypothetical protein